MKADQINVISLAVFCDFEQIKHAQKAGFARQLWSDVRKRDRCNGLDFDFSISHLVTPPFCDMGSGPNPDGAGYIPSDHSFPETFCKHQAGAPFFPKGDATTTKSQKTAGLKAGATEALHF